MNDNADVPNPMLRSHVTDHSFVLTLRKTHIRVLCQIAHGTRSLGQRNFDGVDHFVPAVHGLQRRGLCAHKHHPNFIGKMEGGGPTDLLSNYYRLTRAGWAVFDLLVEAGLAEAIERGSKLRKLVA